MNPERLLRTRLLLGNNALEILANAHVLVLGVGGVGSFAAEELVRAGIGEITLVDGDAVEESNCNRQLPALTSTLGKPKVEVMKERLLDINPELRIHTKNDFLKDEKIPALLETPFHAAIDAIDSLAPKIHFILECRKRNLPLVSSMGSGGKRDPEQIRTADISKTYGCALARAVRKGLREAGVTKGLTSVFSPEEVPPTAVRSWLDEEGKRHSTVGTISYLPAIFGCVCAARTLEKLLKKS